MAELKRSPQAMSMPPFAPMYAYGAENVLLQMMVFNYETKPEIVKQVLPKPLCPAAEPLVTLWFSYFIDPVVHMPGGGVEKMTSYSECGVDMACEYEGEKGVYPVLYFITGLGHGFPGREMHGMPKKQARDITMVHIYDEIMAWATNGVGEKIVSAKGKVTEAIADDIAAQLTSLGPSFNLKIFPRSDGKGYDLNILTRIERRLSNVHNVRVGTIGEIKYQKSKVDPLYLIKVVKVRDVITCLGHMELEGMKNLCKVDEFPTFGIPAW